MDIFCDNCEGRFKIPDEKIPAGRAAVLLCPKCKGRIIVKADEDLAGFSFEDVDETADDAVDKPFDFVEEEGKTALVCESDPARLKRISGALDVMEYHFTVAENSRDALKRLRYHTYDLILVNDEFDTKDPDANPVLIYLERLTMSIRRDIYVVLLSRLQQTMDYMTAFHKSVNLVINLKKLDNFDQILSRGLTDHNFFYRVYRESLKKVGLV